MKKVIPAAAMRRDTPVETAVVAAAVDVASQPQLTGRNVGKTCRTHYRGTFNDGTQFDSSYDRGEPLEFICGAGQTIRGFDAAVADMEVGRSLMFTLCLKKHTVWRIQTLSSLWKSPSFQVPKI